MRQFHGAGGCVFVVSDPLTLRNEPLADVGDGFDWRIADPGRRLLDGAPRFEASDGDGWIDVEPLETERLTGRVSFARCLRGRRVRANGSCLPIAKAATATGWRLRVDVAVVDTTALSDQHPVMAEKRDRTATVTLREVAVDASLAGELERGDVFVLLPFRSAALAGVGALVSSPDTSGVRIEFHEGSVTYVRE